MFESFYGFSVDPFRLTPEYQGFFEHQSFSKARAYIDYALLRGEGIVLVTGRPGTGKSTLIRELQSRMADSDVQVAVVSNARLEAEDLLLMVLDALGLNARQGQGKAPLLLALSEFLRAQQRHGKRVLLVIDEAQDLSVSALEELRLLTNLEHAGRPLLQVLLVGQESLGDLVRSEPLEQLRQRIVASWELVPLTPEESVSYVRHRLQKAGWRGNPAFLPGVLTSIHGFSLGIPRLINLVCSRLLLRGFCLELHELSAEDAEAVLGELRDERLTPRAVGPVTMDSTSAQSGPGSVQSGPGSVGEQGVDWSLLDQGLTLEMADDVSPPVPETVPSQVEWPSAPLREPHMDGGVGRSSRDDWDGAEEVGDEPVTPVAHAPAQTSGAYDLNAALVREDPFDPDSAQDWHQDDPFMLPPVTDRPVTRREPMRPRPGFRFGYALMGLLFLGVAAGVGVYWLLPGQWERIERFTRHWIEAGLTELLSAVDQGPEPLLIIPSAIETNAPVMARVHTSAPEADGVQPDSKPSIPVATPLDSSGPVADSALDGRPVLGAPPSSVSAANISVSQGAATSQSLSGVLPAAPNGLEASSAPEDEPAIPPMGHGFDEAASSGEDPASAGNASSESTLVSSVEESVETEGSGAEVVAAPPPVVMETQLLVEVGFKFNSSTVSQESAEALDKVVALMESSDLATADIQGFTDNTGPPEYNAILARRRAQAVVSYLIKRGLSSERLSVTEGGIHESEDSLSGRRRSGRLVEVRVIGPVTRM